MINFLLFAFDHPLDHDLTINDFIEAFNTPDEAMDYFDEKYKGKYASGAVVKCDIEWQVQYRTLGFSNTESIYRPGWVDGWGTYGGEWGGIKNPSEMES